MLVSFDSCRRAAHMYEQAHLRLGRKPDTDPIEELRAHGALVLDLRLGTSASLEPVLSFLKEGPCIHQLLLYSGEYFFGKESQYRQQISNHHRRHGKKNILEDSVIMRRLIASLSSFLGLRGSSLVVLDLTGIPFGDMELVTPLCRSLSSATQLNRIILANCKLGDAGFKSLIPILTNLRHLHAVSLANNGLTQPALVAQFLRSRLARGRSARIKTTPPLRSFSLVDLSGNPRLVKLGAKRRGNLLIRSICEVLRDGFALKRIVLNGLCLTSANLRPLMNLLSEVADGRVPRFVLEKVDLESNPLISQQLIAVIDQALTSLVEARLNPPKWPKVPTLKRSRSLPQFETVGEPVVGRVRRALSEGSDSDPELELPEDESEADFFRRKIALKSAFDGELRILTAKMYQRRHRKQYHADERAAPTYMFTADTPGARHPGTSSIIQTNDIRVFPPSVITQTHPLLWNVATSESPTTCPAEVRSMSEHARQFAARKASPSFHHDDPCTFTTTPEFGVHENASSDRRRASLGVYEEPECQHATRPETGAGTTFPECRTTTQVHESVEATVRLESATGGVRPESFEAAMPYLYENVLPTATLPPTVFDRASFGASHYVAASESSPAPVAREHHKRTSLSHSSVPMTPPLPEVQDQGHYPPYAGEAVTPPFPDPRDYTFVPLYHGVKPQQEEYISPRTAILTTPPFPDAPTREQLPPSGVPLTPPLPEAQHQGHYSPHAGDAVTPPYPDPRDFAFLSPYHGVRPQQGEHVSLRAAALTTPPFPSASTREQLSPSGVPLTPPLPDNIARFPQHHQQNTSPQQQSQQQMSSGHVTPPASDSGFVVGAGRRRSSQTNVVSPAVSSVGTSREDRQHATTVTAHLPTPGAGQYSSHTPSIPRDHPMYSCVMTSVPHESTYDTECPIAPYSSRTPPMPNDHPTYSQCMPPLPHDGVFSSGAPISPSRAPPGTCSSRTPPATFSSRTPSYYDEDEHDANPFDRMQQQMAYRELNSKTPAPHHVGPLPPLDPARVLRDAMLRDRGMHLSAGESSAVRSEPGPPSPHLAGMDDDSGGPSSRQRHHMGGSDYNFLTPTSSTSGTHSSESETTTVGWSVPRAVRVPNQQWYLRS